MLCARLQLELSTLSIGDESDSRATTANDMQQHTQQQPLLFATTIDGAALRVAFRVAPSSGVSRRARFSLHDVGVVDVRDIDVELTVTDILESRFAVQASGRVTSTELCSMLQAELNALM